MMQYIKVVRCRCAAQVPNKKKQETAKKNMVKTKLLERPAVLDTWGTLSTWSAVDVNVAAPAAS